MVGIWKGESLRSLLLYKMEGSVPSCVHTPPSPYQIGGHLCYRTACTVKVHARGMKVSRSEELEPSLKGVVTTELGSGGDGVWYRVIVILGAAMRLKTYTVLK